LLLDEDSMGRTVWHNAVDRSQIEELETLWEWAKADLRTNELNKNLLLGKDNKETTAWYLAARQCYISELLNLWEWAKQELTTEELYNRFC